VQELKSVTDRPVDNRVAAGFNCVVSPGWNCICNRATELQADRKAMRELVKSALANLIMSRMTFSMLKMGQVCSTGTNSATLFFEESDPDPLQFTSAIFWWLRRSCRCW